MESWMIAQPLTYVGVFVGRIVIDDEVDLLVGCGAGFNPAQEFHPLLMTVLRMKGINHLPGAHVHGREQSGGSMTLVTVRSGGTVAGRARQAGLRAGQCLDLAVRRPTTPPSPEAGADAVPRYLPTSRQTAGRCSIGTSSRDAVSTCAPARSGLLRRHS